MFRESFGIRRGALGQRSYASDRRRPIGRIVGDRCGDRAHSAGQQRCSGYSIRVTTKAYYRRAIRLIRSENSLRIVVLSGPVSAGKSTIANLLRERYGAHVVRTREFIKERSPRVKDERRALQRAGERLDRADNGAWVREGLVRVIESAQAGATPTGMFVVDSVRI